jgi:hypothetical protein
VAHELVKRRQIMAVHHFEIGALHDRLLINLQPPGDFIGIARDSYPSGD